MKKIEINFHQWNPPVTKQGFPKSVRIGGKNHDTLARHVVNGPSLL
jgi:hypothetical protein